MYRQLAEKTENVFGKQELLDLGCARRLPIALKIV
jgi:hypothetical protein